MTCGHTSEADQHRSLMCQAWFVHPNRPVGWTHLGKAQLLFAYMEIKLLS